MPHLLAFLRSLMRLIFNGERWPALGLVVVVVTIDALHAFGNVLLVSNVLPQVRMGLGLGEEGFGISRS